VRGGGVFEAFGLPGFGCFTPTLEREAPMTEMSPLRRRMIEDMKSAICRLRPNDRMCMRLPSSAASSAARLTSLVWRTSGPFRFIWLLAGYRGRR
jgi:hypothetical protein